MKTGHPVRRPWLLPLVGAYGFGVRIKNRLYDGGILKVDRLRRPVISVGSLSAGGAGKTPVVIELARLAAQHGSRVDVLTRGFGRTSQKTLAVRSNLTDSALQFGDEPVEISESASVFVSNSRYEAGLLAERNEESQGHLLDDGFQHRKLRRDLDIVLLTSADGADILLPAGNLREPLSSLERAHVVVVREEEAQDLRGMVASHTSAEIWVIRRELKLPQNLARPFVFCGIARPESFVSMIRALGVQPSGLRFFADHHRYTEADIHSVAASARAAHADTLLCTRKDLVKFGPAWRAVLGKAAPLSAADLSVTFLKEIRVLQAIGDILKE